MPFGSCLCQDGQDGVLGIGPGNVTRQECPHQQPREDHGQLLGLLGLRRISVVLRDTQQHLCGRTPRLVRPERNRTCHHVQPWGVQATRKSHEAKCFAGRGSNFCYWIVEAVQQALDGFDRKLLEGGRAHVGEDLDGCQAYSRAGIRQLLDDSCRGLMTPTFHGNRQLLHRLLPKPPPTAFQLFQRIVRALLLHEGRVRHGEAHGYCRSQIVVDLPHASNNRSPGCKSEPVQQHVPHLGIL
mmetsp:Transcript_12596/g.29885  ORF Transcript_12596/g.29885 Transcript_12596/m.29885 type:complete len:241 (-) Transcript_12596:1343-2065(-)